MNKVTKMAPAAAPPQEQDSSLPSLPVLVAATVSKQPAALSRSASVVTPPKMQRSLLSSHTPEQSRTQLTIKHGSVVPPRDEPRRRQPLLATTTVRTGACINTYGIFPQRGRSGGWPCRRTRWRGGSRRWFTQRASFAEALRGVHSQRCWPRGRRGAGDLERDGTGPGVGAHLDRILAGRVLQVQYYFSSAATVPLVQSMRS